jgi:hypothetical protein
VLGDAATARPRPLIPFNPALRQRNRDARTGRRLAVGAMLITIAYTAMRWGETIGLEREFLQPTLINVEWQYASVPRRHARRAGKGCRRTDMLVRRGSRGQRPVPVRRPGRRSPPAKRRGQQKAD